MLRALPGALLNMEGTARARMLSITSSLKHAYFPEEILSIAVGTRAYWKTSVAWLIIMVNRITHSKLLYN